MHSQASRGRRRVSRFGVSESEWFPAGRAGRSRRAGQHRLLSIHSAPPDHGAEPSPPDAVRVRWVVVRVVHASPSCISPMIVIESGDTNR